MYHDSKFYQLEGKLICNFSDFIRVIYRGSELLFSRLPNIVEIHVTCASDPCPTASCQIAQGTRFHLQACKQLQRMGMPQNCGQSAVPSWLREASENVQNIEDKLRQLSDGITSQPQTIRHEDCDAVLDSCRQIYEWFDLMVDLPADIVVRRLPCTAPHSTFKKVMMSSIMQISPGLSTHSGHQSADPVTSTHD